MPDEFDKPLDQAQTNDFGEDPEVPLIPLVEPGPNNKEIAQIHYKPTTLERLGSGWRWLASCWIGRAFRSSNFWTAAATVVIAIATVVYTNYAKKQWKEMHDGSTDTHNLAVAAKQQAQAIRALAVIQIPGSPSLQVQWIGIYRGANKPFTDVQFKNSGGGAALDVRAAVELTFGGPPPARPYQFRNDKYQDVSEFLPHTVEGTNGAPSRQYARALSREEMAAMMSDGSRVYVWGIVEYSTLDNQRINPVAFCRSTSASDVLHQKAFESEKQIEQGKGGPEYGVFGLLDDCYAK